VGEDGRKEVIVALKRDRVLVLAGFCGLRWLGSLKVALKVEEMWLASNSAHSSSSGSQRGFPLNGERSRRLVGMVLAMSGRCVRACAGRCGLEEKGELRESVELLGELSKSSCANSGAISESCFVCASPTSRSDDGGGDFAACFGIWSAQLIVRMRLEVGRGDGVFGELGAVLLVLETLYLRCSNSLPSALMLS